MSGILVKIDGVVFEFTHYKYTNTVINDNKLCKIKKIDFRKRKLYSCVNYHTYNKLTTYMN
jgi:hypothetical protein